MSRALRFHSWLPIHYSEECLETSTYLINRLPTPVVNFKTPNELLFGVALDYDSLKLFGCLCHAANVFDKFLPRAIKRNFFYRL